MRQLPPVSVVCKLLYYLRLRVTYPCPKPDVGDENALAIPDSGLGSPTGKTRGDHIMGMYVTPIPPLHRGGGVTEDCVSERRLWTAVVARALEDWQRGTLRERRKAQQFIFDDHEDFERACFFAGLDRESLRSRLLKIGQKVEMETTWN